MQKEQHSCSRIDVYRLDRYSDNQGRTGTCLPRCRLLDVRTVNRQEAIELGAPCETELKNLFGDADEFLAFHFEAPATAPTPTVQNQKEQEEDFVDVLSMNSHEVNTLLGAASNQDEQCTLILAWKPKQSKQVMICENGSGGQVVMEAFISHTEGITTQKQLRQCTGYTHSSKQSQKAWQERIAACKASGRQSLWVVTFVQLRVFETPMTMVGQKPRKMVTVSRSQLKTGIDEAPLPQMRLQDTAKYFLDRLSQKDFDEIKQVCGMLDNVVLRVGTTCSGWSLATKHGTFACSICLSMQGQRFRDGICVVL